METVLLSVTDKRGLVDFAKGLKEIIPDVTLIASGGTAKVLEEAKIPYKPIQDITEFPECFGGRVKTLHPKIFGGILYRRGLEKSMPSIDMVVCNLYNFKEAIDKPVEQLLDQIDIGGSALIRSACKNHTDVAVVVDPNDYYKILDEMRTNQGKLSLKTRQRLAVKGINLSADYDSMIAEELSHRLLGEQTRRPRLVEGQKLRYGENPDQEGWVYKFSDQEGIAHAEVLSGKELSYNNYEDATVAFHAAEALQSAKHGVAIVKHGNLCGYATGNTQEEAFESAWEGDTKSAFGSIIAFTTAVTEILIPHLKNRFIEVIIAPHFQDEFVNWAKNSKPNLRLLKLHQATKPKWIYKNISGGMLVQTPKASIKAELFQPYNPQIKRGIVTKRQPKAEQEGLCTFGIAAVQFAKSNTIAIVREKSKGCYQLIGMGSGQPNRVDSLERLAIPKAQENLKGSLNDCILISDGFFPFDDSVRAAAKAGITTCLQPGGSTNDPTVIQTADELNMCMIFTGERYFSH